MTLFTKAGAFVLVGWLWLAGIALAQDDAPALSLQQAMRQAIAYDAGLLASDAGINAARAEAGQAELKPNPVLGLMAENFAGTGPFSAFDGSEITLSYNQTIERGGKRQARGTFGRSEVAVAENTREVRRLDLLHRVQRAYAEAIGANARAEAAEQRVDIAARLLDAVKRRVEQAVDPKSALYRAEVNLMSAHTERDQAMRLRAIAKSQLASLWGGKSDFTLRTASIADSASSDPALSGSNPDEELYRAIERRAQAAYALERAQAKQDPSISLGIRQFGNSEEVAAVAGLSLPFGLYNQNKGGIERAREERVAAELNRIAAERDRQQRVAVLTLQLEAVSAEARSIEAQMLPSAREALQFIRDGYERGAFTYLDVIDAERVLADLQLRYADALKSYHLIKADLDRATARFAGPLPGEETLQ